MATTKRADKLKPGDRIWIWNDTYTVKASSLGRHVLDVRLDLWHPDLGIRPTDFPRDYVCTRVSPRNA